MEEHQVTLDGECRKLPEPFFVIATQNPDRQIGTFPLPESQLDRFLMCLQLGYPDRDAERALLKGEDRHQIIHHLEPCLSAHTFAPAQQAVAKVHASDALLNFVQALVSYTRQSAQYELGLSPRAPEDVQAVLPAVAGHRLRFANEFLEGTGGNRAMEAGEALIHSVAIP